MLHMPAKQRLKTYVIIPPLQWQFFTRGRRDLIFLSLYNNTLCPFERKKIHTVARPKRLDIGSPVYQAKSLSKLQNQPFLKLLFIVCLKMGKSLRMSVSKSGLEDKTNLHLKIILMLCIENHTIYTRSLARAFFQVWQKSAGSKSAALKSLVTKNA